MDEKHRLTLGGLFLLDGLVRVTLGCLILTADAFIQFSNVMIVIGFAVPSLFGGYCLLTDKKDTHKIMPLAAVINLMSLPFGTAIAVYYYWYWKYQCGAPNPFKIVDSNGSTSTVAEPS